MEYDLYGRLAWAKLPSEIDDCLSQYLDWWVSGRAFSSDEGNGPVCQNYYALILDPVILKISHLLNEVMGVINDNERWRIWHMLPMGDDLLLERGEDFRIVEFERRFSSGEWRV